MGVEVRKQRGRPKDDALPARRREEILEAATRLFAERGYADTDTQLLADRLRVGKGTIYRYFASKEELFQAAVDRGMQRLMAAVEARVAGLADPLDRIAAAIHAFLGYYHDHPEQVELFIQERAVFQGRRKPAYFAHHEANVGPWREMYQKMAAQGRVRDLPAAADHDVVSDLLYGTILANHFAARRIPPECQARNVIDIVFHGILTESERKRREGGGRSC